MKLQYMLSNGEWLDCEDRTEEFLTRCETNEGKNRTEIIAILLTGKTVRNRPSDWYSLCRDIDAITEILRVRELSRVPVVMKKCSCGHTVAVSLVMSSSTGSSCPDCYDRMSE